ncbi:fumarylacetoacetate hydrolase family protein [Caenibius tardaugens NBRC 16725]|uniref:Fumarylacetoacetate hydrolase family protein n=1 Tax=Caenibius tardaugens NBRC 16725 TaxID=1219035 RepID=U2YP52_9SPHN|nr:fumarylacetoacetate hydrolase family protein [Caenibius tardaugens]AZI35503.1 FAA hydrolase family protein [Caenibius tardaugens NBRC 16725]GAD50397.1 fumarylacetoacetate hydrolase family protein [Caenibius tardaugens NBRC 16725]
MKIARYEIAGQIELGITDGQSMASISRNISGAGNDMIALIQRWDELGPQVETLLANPDHALSELRLLAPIARPGKIWGIGLNYADHASEAGIELPEHQTWFVKASTSANGPFDPVQLPVASAALDYEAELVAVIGRGGRHIPAESAGDAIFGYCVGNDVSVRDWQLRTGQFSIGKSFDSHAPFGPWIVTADEIDAATLGIRSFVNGEMRQNSNTSHLIFSPAQQVAHLSQAMTLEAGDLLFTGTPGGVGAAMTPPRFLGEGDVVRVEIDGIGHIENRVEKERPA